MTSHLAWCGGCKTPIQASDPEHVCFAVEGYRRLVDAGEDPRRVALAYRYLYCGGAVAELSVCLPLSVLSGGSPDGLGLIMDWSSGRV